DVVLLGAGTARDEGYGAMALPEESVRWRLAHGLAPQPVFALVSQRLALDPDAPLFADAPVRPLVFTVEDAPAGPRAALAEVADVVTVGAREVDPMRVREELRRRGLLRIHSEGGPTLFGAFLAAGAVDELCLTLAPTLEAGPAQRIAHAMPAVPTAMELAGVLRAGDELLLRYRRAEGSAGWALAAPAGPPRRAAPPAAPRNVRIRDVSAQEMARILTIPACGAGARPAGPVSAVLGGAGLRADEPRLLLELLEDGVEDVRRGGVRLVDLVVHGAHGARRLLDRGGHQVDRDVGEHLALRELGQGGLLGDHGRAGVRRGVQRAHPLGDVVGARTRDRDHLVEVQVQVAEVRAHDVPVRLLA